MKPLFPPTVMADLTEPDTCEACGRHDDDPCEDCCRGHDFVDDATGFLWFAIICGVVFPTMLIVALLAWWLL